MNLSKPLIIILLFSINVLAQNISMTVTQDNLALVKETRSLNLKKGFNLVQISDLPTLLDPTSINLFLADQSVKLSEFFFAFDLKNTEVMLQKSIGKSIRALHPELGTVQGKLISVQSRMLVIQTSDGELRVIPDYNGTQIVLEKSELQDNLVIQPTIFCSLESKSNSKTKTDISYLTTGLNWQTEYMAIISDTEKELSLSTRAIISNYSGKQFEECKLLLLAGEINKRQTLRRGVSGSGIHEMSDMITMASESDFQENESFEYHIYRLDRSFNLENHQQKIVPLYPTIKAGISKTFTYHHQKDPKNISVDITVLNTSENGLGHPLPAGTVRIYSRDEDRLLILGMDNISHIPVGEEVKIKIGQAFDIMAERIVMERKREGKNNEKLKISIEFRNQKNEDIEIVVTEPITRRSDYRILSSTIEVNKKEAKQIEFIVPVKANQKNKLEYEILYSW